MKHAVFAGLLMSVAIVSVALTAGCSDTTAMPSCTATMPAGTTALAGPDGTSACTEAGGVAIAMEADLAADGYTVVGPAFTFTGAGPFPHGIDIVLPYSTGKVSSDQEGGLVVLAKKRTWAAHAAAVSNLVIERAHGKVHFHTPDVATYQVARKTDAGNKASRHYTFRAVAGVSMGGVGSSINFWRHPERYDAIGVMGADPGPDLTYTLGMIHDWFMAGFCTADDGAAKIGMLCPAARKPLADQLERMSSFESFLYEKGEGVGLTLRRSLYVRANRDLARALGNAAYYNPDSPYLPPGVPASVLSTPNAALCANPVVLKNFYDKRYNPDGKFDVITFCDGNDSDAVGLGKFDPATPATDPTQILLAVDVNGNGRRDSGEPVIVQGNEPFSDVGTDGKADADEPGYDAATNPDPNGDDYHYLWNPTGTENNWRYDQGEPFEDNGVDGVWSATGGCDAMAGKPNCYDYGEGNGVFDYVPNAANWRARDPRTNLEKLGDADLARLDTWYDAGIRDFFNAQVSTNSLMGALMAKGVPVRSWEGFPSMAGGAPAMEQQFDVNKVDWSGLGRHVYVRYGNPDATDATVEATGDGRHVGTATQAIHRAQSLLFFLASRFPDGDRALAPVDSSHSRVSGMFHSAAGRDSPYTVVLPPGYTQPENATKRYPVVYFMHGYGMDPEGIASLSVIAQNAMVDDRQPDDKRMQKFILVLVDAKCRPGGDVKQAPLPTNGDLCEEGTFYTDHPEGTAKGESELMELQDYIDQNYRTKAPADFPVVN
ncbi:MAG: hypothetical protein JWN44_209 [Myxococcales bacterium]|nr:hypothetical protein [Myxococcales bacterium]